MEQFLEGFALQATLIFALGAQNIFVLESGLHRRRHLLVASVCTLCDALLIAIGVGGAATIFVEIPLLKIGFGVAGVAFLAYYGLLKIMTKPSIASEADPTLQASKLLSVVISQTLAFSLLNPHVYLDTIVLIGGFSAQYADFYERVSFGGGAALFSAIWFFSLAIFSAKMSHYLTSPKAMRTISLVSGAILILLAFSLGVDVWMWLSQSQLPNPTH